ncbi:hypothetical protein F3B42_12100 [Bacteroides ovatus]|uniref:Uncharacterized protein n=1 Tax=Bacteroides ovatus TaxID=28116 RepID=A0A7J4XY45_BACOV|nr:hypothetical protein F3B90_12825 [Bacteroides ovatus]KAA4637785.1 hypothetical protein F3B52_14860 [Bacteroides ovatus]KAA4672580.1 hypothetical protein F3B42_12100 [Bacteroides ovatus]KAA4681616.1 hypothetical protein F3B41_13935 [Bacteroides ovatus]
MITIEKKDIIVAMLVASNESLTDLYVSDLKEHNITGDECDMVLRQLEKMQFIDIKHRFSRPSGFTVAINSGLHEFSSRGAFKAQELILSTQLERLDIEIQLMKSQLTPDKLDQFSKVFSIFGSVCSMLPYIKIAHGE